MADGPDAASPAPEAPPRRGRVALLAAGVVLLGLFAYSNALGGAFVFDDLRQVRDNPAVRELASALFGPAWARVVSNRAVGYLTFALNYRMGGVDPHGYHAVNVAIHVANALLVLALVLLAFRAPRARGSSLAPAAGAVGFLAAAVFATHPMGSQAVTYVVQRLASLATFFYLLAVVLYLAWRLPRSPSRGRAAGVALYGGALVASFLGFRTKEITFTLPATLVLAELVLLDGRGWRRLLPVVPVALLALVIPLSTLGLLPGAVTGLTGGGSTTTERLASASQVATEVATPVGRAEYLRAQVGVVVDYLRLLAVPAGQTIDHDVAVPRSPLAPRVLLSGAVLLALAALGAWLAVRSRPAPGRRPVDGAAAVAAFGIGWFFVTASVESSVIPIVDLMYEHRAYLPSVGVYVAFAAGAGLALRRLAPAAAPRSIVLLGLALALLLGSLTLRRNLVWRDDVSLWSDAAEKAPGKFRPQFNLGTALLARGDFRAAVEPLRRAAELEDPGHADAAAQLGAVYLRLGRPGDAETAFRAALARRADDPDVLFNLGMLLVRTGRRDEGVLLLRRYLDVAPPGPARDAARRVAGAE